MASPFQQTAEAISQDARAEERASEDVRKNPLLSEAGVIYGYVAVAKACDTVLGLPVPLITTGSEAARVIEHLSQNRKEKEIGY